MNILLKTRLALAAMLSMNFASVETDKGPLEYDGEKLEVDTEVFIKNADGILDIPADGDYVIGSDVVTIVEGKVTEIKPSEPMTDEPVETELEDETEPENPTPQDGTVSREEFNALEERFNTLIAIVKDLNIAVNELKGQQEETYTELSKALKRSAAKPVEKSDTTKVESAGNNVFK